MASKRFTRLFKVLYDFHAEDEGELSVVAGEVVRGRATDDDVKYGWILVQTASPPFSQGYVPKDYVSPAETSTNVSKAARQQGYSRDGNNSIVESPRRSSGSITKPATPGWVGSTVGSPEVGQHRARATSGGKNDYGVSPVSRRRNQSDLVDTPATHRQPVIGVNQRRPSSSRSMSVDNNIPLSRSRPSTPSSPSGRRMAFVGDFAPHVEEHDKWLRDIMSMREENQERLQRSLDKLSHRMEAMHEQSGDTMKKMDKLESMVETERRQWRDRLDAEKLASTNQIARRFGLDAAA